MKSLQLKCSLGSDPERLFPYSALQGQLQKFGKYGLANASLVLPIIMAEADFDESIVTKNHVNNGPAWSKSFTKRIRDIVADMYQLGYI